MSALETIIILALLHPFIWCAGPAEARLSPSSKAKIRQADAGFSSCRTKARKAFKMKKKGRQEATLDLLRCKESYPAGAFYRSCKASAVRKHRRDVSKIKRSLRECRRMQSKMVYNRANPVPVFQIKSDTFYTGIGMNAASPSEGFRLPHYDCMPIKEALSGFRPFEYLLFGNSLRLFGPFKQLPAPRIIAALKAKKASQPGEQTYYSTAGFGRIYDPKLPIVFFPSSYCTIAADPGPLFSDHKIYYLSNKREKTLTPYFAVSFYKDTFRQLESKAVAKRVAQTLGKDYRVFTSEDKKAHYIAKARPSELDSEGDPKNVCRDAQQDLLGIVRNRPDNRRYPAYLLVANTKNICSFGERLAQAVKIQ